MQNPQVLLNPAGNNLDEIWQFLNALRHDLHNNIRQVDQVNYNLNNIANGARAYAADLNHRMDQLDDNHHQRMNQLDDNHNQRMDRLENLIMETRDLVLQVQQSNQGTGARFDGLDERINNHQLMINGGAAGLVELRRQFHRLKQVQTGADQRFRGFREDYIRTLSATQYNRISRSFSLAPSYHNQPLPIISLKSWDNLNHPANIHTYTEDQLDELGEHYGLMLPNNDRARKIEWLERAR